MIFWHFYFIIIYFLLSINGGFCDVKAAKWWDSCKELGQNMQNLTYHLDQILQNKTEVVKEIIEKINKLKDFAVQLAELIRNEKRILLAQLVVEHAQKIERFCENLLIGGEASWSNSEMIRQMLRAGIDQTKGRIVQIRQLMDTMLIDWEVWPILCNFELYEGPTDTLDNLIEELGAKISKMGKMLGECGSYYNSHMFEEAIRQLIIVAKNETDGNLKRLVQIRQIVPKLMAKATLDMLDNVLMDLLDPTSPFYGTKILFAFAMQINVAENIVANILSRSTLVPMERYMIHDHFEKLRDKANQMFEEQKDLMGGKMKNIGTMLKNEMAQLQIEKDTIKREPLMETLQKMHNVFVIAFNGLQMIDSLGSSKMVEHKLDKLGELIKQQQEENLVMKHEKGMPPNAKDEIGISAELAECLNVEKIEKRIIDESESLGYKILF